MNLRKLLARLRPHDPLAALRAMPTDEERARLEGEQFRDEMELALAHGVHEVSAYFNAASLRGRALAQLVHDGCMTCTRRTGMYQGRRTEFFTYAPTAKARQFG